MNPLRFYHQDAIIKTDGFNPNCLNVDFDLDSEQKQFTALVFAPDPLTFNPTSDVAFIMSSADEGFKNYVREHLLSPSPVGSLADTSEEAEQVVKPNLMTGEQYYHSMREYVASLGVPSE